MFSVILLIDSRKLGGVVSHWADYAAVAGVSDALKSMIGEGIMVDVTE